MPWTLVTVATIAPGDKANIGNVLVSNQSWSLYFPDFSSQEVRRFGTFVWLFDVTLSPTRTIVAETQSRNVWHNGVNYNLGNGTATGRIQFRVPVKFGSDLRVESWRFTP